MKAVILIGGLGTRLYPLTYTTPKSLLPIVDVPFLNRSISWLKFHGIRHLIFAVSNLATPIIQYVDQLSIASDLNITFRLEEVPLGSGGALKNCRDLIDDQFILYNGDILTDLDLNKIIEYHNSRGAVVTATFGQVDNPTHYGIAHMDNNGKLLGWQEKPSIEEAKSNWGNVGVWIMSPEILDYIPENQFVSIEKETFPILFKDKVPFFGYRFQGYWKDIGTIDKYHHSNVDILEGRVSNQLVSGREFRPGVFVGDGIVVEEDVNLEGPIYIGKNSYIGKGSNIIGPISIGEDCFVGDYCDIRSSLVWSDSHIQSKTKIDQSVIATASIGENCEISRSVVSTDSTIEKCSVLIPGTVIGPSSKILRK